MSERPWRAWQERAPQGAWFIEQPSGADLFIGTFLGAEEEANMIADALNSIARITAERDALRAALQEMVTWMPSGFAPQSQDRAMKMAYDALALTSTVPMPSEDRRGAT